ncbi:MAG TPA: histidine kinase N-terminal 7TM domain-containing protein [Nocardioides sp.]|nr:histidine kinase N-terminal 7TM domain-containing protein [Nocardioides sp.]
MRVRLAWTLFGVTVVVAVLHVIVLVMEERPLFSEDVMAEGFPLVTLGALGGAFVGVLIISRYPGHPIGWLFLLGQLLSEVGVALGDYGYGAVSGSLAGAPGGHVAIWLSVQAGGVFVVSLLAVLFLLAPDGHLASRRWAWALWLTITGLLAHIGAVMTVSPGELNPGGELQGEPGPVLTILLVASSVAVFVGVLAGLLSMWVRLRRARGEERQQMQLMALGAAVLLAGMSVNTLAAVLDGPTWVREQPLMASYACLPVFTAVAILRYRLYDIDVFLNRAITLTILSGFVFLGYVTVVVLIGTALPLARDRFWPSLLATALVALAVQPVREWAERLAARLVYGRRAAPYVELAEFSKRLQESPGTEPLLRRVAESVARAVGARQATIVVGTPDQAAREVTWPEQVARGLGDTTTLRVADPAGSLGQLSVTMPPRTSLQPEEVRLLEDFAAQLARALRNVHLESALTHQVLRLRESTVALEASSHRLALAQDMERRRFEAALSRTVVPHLHVVRDNLASLLRGDLASEGDRGDAEAVLVESSALTRASLESLRSLTRGVFPTQLERRGLVAALNAYLDATGAEPARTSIATRRLAPRVESTAYFCVVEFVRELDGPGEVALRTVAGALEVEVTGPPPPPSLSRIEHIHDRVAALDGSMNVAEVEARTTMTLRLPLGAPLDDGPDAAEALGVEVDLGDVGVGTGG